MAGLSQAGHRRGGQRPAFPITERAEDAERHHLRSSQPGASPVIRVGHAIRYHREAFGGDSQEFRRPRDRIRIDRGQCGAGLEHAPRQVAVPRRAAEARHEMTVGRQTVECHDGMRMVAALQKSARHPGVVIVGDCRFLEKGRKPPPHSGQLQKHEGRTAAERRHLDEVTGQADLAGFLLVWPSAICEYHQVDGHSQIRPLVLGQGFHDAPHPGERPVADVVDVHRE